MSEGHSTAVIPQKRGLPRANMFQLLTLNSGSTQKHTTHYY